MLIYTSHGFSNMSVAVKNVGPGQAILGIVLVFFSVVVVKYFSFTFTLCTYIRTKCCLAYIKRDITKHKKTNTPPPPHTRTHPKNTWRNKKRKSTLMNEKSKPVHILGSTRTTITTTNKNKNKRKEIVYVL